MEACKRRSCHICLHRQQPPPWTLSSHVAKCLIRSWTPRQVENLEQGFFVGSTSCGPTFVHPSLQMCSKHSIASLSWRYTFCSFLCLLHLFFLYIYKQSKPQINNWIELNWCNGGSGMNNWIPIRIHPWIAEFAARAKGHALAGISSPLFSRRLWSGSTPFSYS